MILLITIIVTVFTAFAFYLNSKAMGASRIKWSIAGILVSLVPIIIIPNVIICLTGREDLDGLAFMAAVIFVMILSVTIQRINKK